MALNCSNGLFASKWILASAPRALDGRDRIRLTCLRGPSDEQTAASGQGVQGDARVQVGRTAQREQERPAGDQSEAGDSYRAFAGAQRGLTCFRFSMWRRSPKRRR